MPRPRKQKKIEEFWQDLSAEDLLDSDLTINLRRVGASPEVRAVLTVLTNERPSATGVDSAQFIQGYELCLRRAKELFQGEVVHRVKDFPEPDYSTPEIRKEVTWQTPE